MLWWLCFIIMYFSKKEYFIINEYHIFNAKFCFQFYLHSLTLYISVYVLWNLIDSIAAKALHYIIGQLCKYPFLGI